MLCIIRYKDDAKSLYFVDDEFDAVEFVLGQLAHLLAQLLDLVLGARPTAALLQLALHPRSQLGQVADSLLRLLPLANCK